MSVFFFTPAVWGHLSPYENVMLCVLIARQSKTSVLNLWRSDGMAC
ncbi:MAG: hypothetical protein ACWA5T_06390 [Parvularcula sp.]